MHTYIKKKEQFFYLNMWFSDKGLEDNMLLCITPYTTSQAREVHTDIYISQE